MSARDGGPAFPVTPDDERAVHNDGSWGSVGVTLRDYFAAKALDGLLANPARCPGAEVEGGQTAYARLVAKVSFEFADAMLAAREGGES